jgi:hypothetical protein
MLREWLGPTTADAFVSTHLQRQAWASPGVAREALGLFDWNALGRLLELRELDLLVVARGRLLDAARPHSLGEARAMMAAGIGFVIRHGERHDPGLAAFAEAFVREFPGQAHVQLFITPGGTHGFGWHYDAEELFIAQTAGVKDYYFRANTVTAEIPRSVRHDFGHFREETSPLQTAQLLPADLLYLPARWWHMAQCVEDSLSISLGVVLR